MLFYRSTPKWSLSEFCNSLGYKRRFGSLRTPSASPPATDIRAQVSRYAILVIDAARVRFLSIASA